MRITRFVGTVLLILSIVNFSFGQDDVTKNYISKGQWLVGGGLSFSKVNVGYDFSVSPMGGYLLGEKIAVGLSTGYSHNKYSSRYGFSNSSFSVQPFFRYYITQNKLSAFAEVAYGLAWSKYNYVDYTYNIPMEQKNTKFTSKIGVGLDYFITNNVAIEGNLRYTSTDFPQGMLNFSVGLQVFIR